MALLCGHLCRLNDFNGCFDRCGQSLGRQGKVTIFLRNYISRGAIRLNLPYPSLSLHELPYRQPLESNPSLAKALGDLSPSEE